MNAVTETTEAPAAVTRTYRLLRFVAIATAVAVALWLLSDVLIVVFASVLLAVILHGAADLLHRRVGLPYWACLMAVVVLALAAVAGLVAYAGPRLAEQVDQLRKALGDQGQGLHDRIAQYSWGNSVLDQIPKAIGGNKETSGAAIPGNLAGTVAGVFSSIFGLFGTLVVILISGLYMAADPSLYVNGALRLLPVRYRPQGATLARTAGHALWGWSAGQAIDMLVVGILSGTGLWLLGVPLALVLGVIAALFNFVPYIGAIAGSAPAVILGFSVGTTTGIETIALYCLVQGFEGNVMAPMIQKRAVDMPPGLTVLSQTAFGSILGIPGLIFATPITAALLAALRQATPELDPADRVG